MTETRSLSKAKIWNWLKIVFALGLFAYVISRTDYEQLLALKDRFSWAWFWVSLLAFFLMLGIKTLQYYVLFGRKLSYARTLDVVVIQNILMNFVATAAGIASYLTMLGVEKDVRFGKATLSFVLVKIGDIIAVLFLFLVSLFFLNPISAAAMPVVVFVRVFAAFFFVFLLAAILFRYKFIAVITRLAALFKVERWPVMQKGLFFLEQIASYDQRKMLHTIVTASSISFVYMALTMFWAYARFRVFSFPIDFFVIVFVISILQFASWMPIYVFGGLGVSEGIAMYLLGFFGLQGTELAAILIGTRVVTYVLNATTILVLPLKSLFVRDPLPGNHDE